MDSESTQDVNTQNEQGRTILHDAVQKNDISTLLKILKETDIDLDIQDNLGNSALHYCTNPSALNILLAAGADITIENYQNQTILNEMLWKQHCYQLQPILFKIIGDSLQLPFVKSGSLMHRLLTVIYWQVSENSTIHLLRNIFEWTHFNNIDSQGNTALHHALILKKYEIARYLLGKCNLDTKNFQGETPLMICGNDGKSDFAKYFVAREQSNDKMYPVEKAMEYGNLDFLKLILKEVQEIDTFGGHLLLVNTSSSSDMEIALLDAGCPYNYVDFELKRTVLHHATAYKKIKLIKRLLSLNYKFEHFQDSWGQRPMDYIITDQKIMSLFLYHNIVPSRTTCSTFIFNYTMQTNYIPMLNLLLEKYDIEFEITLEAFLNYIFNILNDVTTMPEILNVYFMLLSRGVIKTTDDDETFEDLGFIMRCCYNCVLNCSIDAEKFVYETFFRTIESNKNVKKSATEYFVRFPTADSGYLIKSLLKYKRDYDLILKILWNYANLGAKYSSNHLLTLINEMGLCSAILPIISNLSVYEPKIFENNYGYFLDGKIIPNYHSYETLNVVCTMPRKTISHIIKRFAVDINKILKILDDLSEDASFLNNPDASVFPSLRQLSRDEVRRNIAKSSKTPLCLIRNIQSLNLPTILIRTLLLDIPIYFCN